jgi:sugar (pentulose or hexulose) kinase
MSRRTHRPATVAGALCPEWAQKLGLPEGIPVAIGEFDVHYGAIGSGVDEGVFVKAIGTSTCDCCVVHADKPIADIPGICGIVKGAILPGYYGIEAGQSAFGWTNTLPQENALLWGLWDESFDAGSIGTGCSATMRKENVGGHCVSGTWGRLLVG